MRQITLDIETTGLNPNEGHKIIEIGCVELIDNFPTGNTWQSYINPNRSIPQEAYEIHGLTEEFLSTKPTFYEVSESFINFIKNSELVIHNAKFDMGFINYELEENNIPVIKDMSVLDTVILARKIFPGQSVSLDALCKRYKINLEKRKFHGALLDAELLAEVYLELKGGRQQGIDLNTVLNNTRKQINFEKISYSKKIYELKEEEKKKYKKLITNINK